MRVPMVYLLVVLVWSSTPLGIQLSSDSFSFVAAVTVRMGIALTLALLILKVLGRKLFQSKDDWKVYAAAAVGIFPALPLVYWGAQFIPSGLVSVIFGLTPFITGLVTMIVLRENPFDWQKLIGLGLAVLGLLIIFQGQLVLGVEAVYGVLGVLASTVIFSFSSVTLQRFASNIDPMRQATGALLLAFPCLLLTWWVLDGELPESVSPVSWLAVSYLAVMGSLLGFPAYFYLLKRLSASTVSLTTLITPGIALVLGAAIAGEKVGESVLWGASLIIISLAFYQGLLLKGLKLMYARIRA